VRQALDVSERRASRTLGQHRSTQRKFPQGREDEARLTDDIIELARKYGRYGYRQVTALLKEVGWCVNHKRVERRALSRHRSERQWRAAARGAEGPAEAEETPPSLAERRLPRPAPAGAAEPCLVLRLRPGPHP
jgi:hypothetical protein